MEWDNAASSGEISMEWYIPFNQLSTSQHQVIREVMQQLRQVHWIRGCAGTGKTLVLAHLAERIAKTNPSAKLCILSYTHALKDLVLDGLFGRTRGDDDARDWLAARIEVNTHSSFLYHRTRADFVLVDEVQDIQPKDLSKIRNQCGHLMLAGDPAQRIYLTNSTGADIEEMVTGKVFELREVFRLTPENRALAQRILNETNLVAARAAKASESIHPQVHELDSDEQEVLWVWNSAFVCAAPGHPVAILFPSHAAIYRFATILARLLERPTKPPDPSVQQISDSATKGQDYTAFNSYWSDIRPRVCYLGNKFGNLAASDDHAHIYLMTYHSSKGLDFRSVFLPGLNSDTEVNPLARGKLDSDAARRLLFVAATRSRKRLLLSHSSPHRHPILARIDAKVLPPFDTESWKREMEVSDDDPFA
jgi:hypothetical protein